MNDTPFLTYRITQATNILDKQSELYGEIIDNAIEVVEKWLNNKSAVLEVVVKTIEERDENGLHDRMTSYNGEHGDGLTSTVEKAWGDIETLTKEYGEDVETIVTTLQKGVRIENPGLIDVEKTDYEKPTWVEDLASTPGDVSSPNSSAGFWQLAETPFTIKEFSNLNSEYQRSLEGITAAYY